MASNVIPIRAEVAQLPDPETLGELGYREIARRLARAAQLEAVTASFVAHVRARKQAGWHGVPMKPDTLPSAGAGFEQLAALVED